MLNDVETAALEENEAQTNLLEEEDEIWLGEPSAHLNHVSAYHQVVREQMQSIVETLQSQHKKVGTLKLFLALCRIIIAQSGCYHTIVQKVIESHRK